MRVGNQPVASERRQLLGLDLVRFFSALGVALLHLGFAIWKEPQNATPEGTRIALELAPLSEVARTGWVGVYVFFVLSGLLIALTSEGRGAGVFLRNRVLRLYPGVWLAATLTAIILLFSEPVSLAAYVRSMLLTPVGPWIDYVYWTLAIEVAFYAVAAIALACGIKMLTLGYALVIAGTLFWGARALDFLLGGAFAELFRAFEHPVLKLTLLPYASYFGLGILLWHVLFKAPTRLGLLAVAASATSGIIGIATYARFFATQFGGSVVTILAPVLIWIVAVLLIVLSIRYDRLVDRALGKGRRFIHALGLATYPLYLIHHEVGQKLMQSLQAMPGIPLLLFALIAMVAVALLLVSLERPLRSATGALIDRMVGTSSLPASSEQPASER